MNALLGLFLYAFGSVFEPTQATVAPIIAVSPAIVAAPTTANAAVPTKAATVPFYSQFKDISSAKWQKVGCGVTSLAMVIDYYQAAVPVDTLLTEAVKLGAYQSDVGWSYAGLISTAKKYGMQGVAYDLGSLSTKNAYAQFSSALANGPVIASVHYKFDPKSTIPHLVVVNSIKNGVLYYNDPAAKSGNRTISVADFEKGWKKRYIIIRPVTTPAKIALN